MKQYRLKQFLCLLFFLLWCASRNLALMQEYAALRGAQLLFVCAPDKNTVYPEFMPARYVRSTSERNLDRLLASLREQGVPFCDVRDVLRNANSLTYYRTDSHWNGYGSALRTTRFCLRSGATRRWLARRSRISRTAATSLRCSIPPHRAQKTALPLRTRAAFPMRTIFTPQTTSASAPAPPPPARF